ncbi:CPBP family intramembrane glutamic endopeptidase [uncultured Algibacter sp.]|uniref:CPBP family intramembrane glutamic endopeptidase n=1 Tax=uncultured Algibacter sp. TaxID=298659 RepID=UPI002625C185|nr:CPBP family intramembrane glutamic endopeptidase [uncultured Algibacter sp.]
MQSTLYKSLELFIVFVLIPISFAIDYSVWIKLGIGVFGFIYVIYVLLRVEKIKLKIAKQLDWKTFWKATAIKLSLIIIITISFVWVTDSTQLFNVLLNKPLKWLMLLFIYSFFSVYPQELIYRTFFFKRYGSLLKSDSLFIFINAILFSLAHFFFRSPLVLLLTFLGGILFALTFKKTESTLLVSIEHAIYGCWLFTVGMGEILGFPS